jgi:hypothetical protein
VHAKAVKLSNNRIEKVLFIASVFMIDPFVFFVNDRQRKAIQWGFEPLMGVLCSLF